MKIISSKIAYTCPIFRVEERQVEIKKGVIETHWVVVAKPNISVVALTKNKKIILNKEIRSHNTQEYIGLPSGKASEYKISNQQAKNLAHQELLEETGHQAKYSKLLDIVCSGSHYFTRCYYQFAAWDLEFVGQQLEAGEKIESWLVTIPQIKKLIKENKIISINEQEAIKKAIKLFKKKGII